MLIQQTFQIFVGSLASSETLRWPRRFTIAAGTQPTSGTSSMKREGTSSVRSNCSFQRTRCARRQIQALGFKSISVCVVSAQASRSRFASASFLRCASGQPACVVLGRLVGFRNVRTDVCFACPFRSRRARYVATSSPRQRVVSRTQALAISRSCRAFGVALSFAKGWAFLSPNSSFKADASGAA